MNQHPTKHPRVLAIAPSTRGFGFAVFEERETLVDWGVKSAQGDKNKRSLVKVGELIAHYEPRVVVLEDSSGEGSRRSVRIRNLGRRIITLAASLNVCVVVLSRKQIRQVFFTYGEGTKHALAEILAKRFPEELGPRLPPKRKPWKSEDCRMDIFAAVALAVALRLRTTKRTAYGIPKHKEGDADITSDVKA
jgi:hypothetical protein